jgi:hypothetical protein
LTPTTRITWGPAAGFERARHRFQDLGDIAGQRGAHLGFRHVAGKPAAGHFLGEPHRGVDPEIGRDQQVFEVAQRRRIELAVGKYAADAVGQAVRRFAQAGAQPGQPAARFVVHAAERCAATPTSLSSP